MSHKKYFPVYGTFLHLSLIALAIGMLMLARENRALERQLTEPESEPTFVAGDAMPTFSAHELDGTEVEIAPTDREQLLFFFTTTCGACAENQAQWRSLYEQVGPEVDVVGVSLDPPDTTQRYVAEQALPYRVVTVPDSQSFAREHNIFLVPYTLHVGADGRVRQEWTGVMSDEELAGV